jgi:hypothetical protein
MVSRLQIYGQLLQKYGAIHRQAVKLLQIYGPDRMDWLGICFATNLWLPTCPRLVATDLWLALFCYRFMVPVHPRLLLQIYGRPGALAASGRLQPEANSNTLHVSAL